MRTIEFALCGVILMLGLALMAWVPPDGPRILLHVAAWLAVAGTAGCLIRLVMQAKQNGNNKPDDTHSAR